LIEDRLPIERPLGPHAEFVHISGVCDKRDLARLSVHLEKTSAAPSFESVMDNSIKEERSPVRGPSQSTKQDPSDFVRALDFTYLVRLERSDGDGVIYELMRRSYTIWGLFR
jgi:hypothetical protein